MDFINICVIGDVGIPTFSSNLLNIKIPEGDKRYED